ncbi:hypothetical protein OSB04_020035 [Centaurea solstitialis]|uniref:Uncharacterized protein n=1 Tax=Centaurea solstitialis TaxID=347529 RepID=A0AA38W3H2_9ASTR|nr:hypothetical protein OSB04_020035 [Centaurea solstitialis]
MPTKDDGQSIAYSSERIANVSRYMANREQLRNRETHNALKKDLIEHKWQKIGTVCDSRKGKEKCRLTGLL